MSLSIVDALRLWPKLSANAPGRWLFSRIIGAVVPYTGGLRAVVERLAPGDTRVVLRERRAVRNHLRSVHAMAIGNVLEYSTGLAVNSLLSGGQRGILVRFQIEYLKKARGTLVSSAKFEPPDEPLPAEWICEGELHDSDGDLCARAKAYWRIDARG